MPHFDERGVDAVLLQPFIQAAQALAADVSAASGVGIGYGAEGPHFAAALAGLLAAAEAAFESVAQFSLGLLR